MIRSLQAIVILSLFAAPALAQGFEADTHRFGATYKTLSTGSAGSCASLCEGEASCQSWSWLRGVAGAPARCELKAAEGRPEHNPLAVSGLSQRIRSEDVIYASLRRDAPALDRQPPLPKYYTSAESGLGLKHSDPLPVWATPNPTGGPRASVHRKAASTASTPALPTAKPRQIIAPAPPAPKARPAPVALKPQPAPVTRAPRPLTPKPQPPVTSAPAPKVTATPPVTISPPPPAIQPSPRYYPNRSAPESAPESGDTSSYYPGRNPAPQPAPERPAPTPDTPPATGVVMINPPPPPVKAAPQTIAGTRVGSTASTVIKSDQTATQEIARSIFYPVRTTPEAPAAAPVPAAPPEPVEIGLRGAQQ